MSHGSGLEGPACLGSLRFSVASGPSRRLHVGELLKPEGHLSLDPPCASVPFAVNALFSWSFLSSPHTP